MRMPRDHLSRILATRAWLRSRPTAGYIAALAAYALCLIALLAAARLGLHHVSRFAFVAPALVLAPLLGGAAAGLLLAVLTILGALIFLFPSAPASELPLDVFLISTVIISAVVILLELTIDRLVRERERSDQLLREVQHRTANNFQSVASIVHLHQRMLGHEDGRSALRDVEHRVLAMGQLHKRLSSIPDDSLSVFEQLELLCSEVIGSAGSKQITWSVDASDRIALPARRLLTLSLIVNEIIMNAIKYAFPEGASGRLTIRVVEEGNQVALTIADDGVGMIEDRSGGGLGTAIVKSLAQQLGGVAEWRRATGTTFILRFPR
jgi:two-component sensor histidine kinase